MPDTTLRERSEIPIEFTWNAESVYPDRQAWDAEAEALVSDLAQFEGYHGRLGEGPPVLLEVFGAIEDTLGRALRLFAYSYVNLSVDSLDPQAAEMLGRAQDVVGKVLAAFAFVDPELIALGAESVRGWIQENERLAIFKHYVDNLFRTQEHVRSGEVEEILGS